jgi:hypothetical protein
LAQGLCSGVVCACAKHTARRHYQSGSAYEENC